MTLSPRNHDGLTDFQQGNYFAVKELFDEYYSLLTDFANQLIIHEAEAHFIVQETFIKLFLMRDRFETQADIKAFLYITVRNTCFAYLRAEKPEAPAADISWLQLAMIASSRFDDDTVRSTALDHLHQQITYLPEPEQTVFRALFYDRLTIPAAAEQLELTPVAVSQHRIDAVCLFREQLVATDMFSIPLFIYFIAVFCGGHVE
jgi:RNA polymerase sigma-70 factor (ECF subfamily)